MGENFEPVRFMISMIVIFIAITIHEFCHAKFADLAGDPTPRIYGRVTLNPMAHLDPIGTIMIIVSSLSGFGIGWGRPVMVDPRKMRNPRWDHFVSVAAGPLSNFLQAAVFAIVIRLIGLQNLEPFSPFWLFLISGLTINLGLFFFNLIPIGPLDGHWMIGTFMPEPMRLRWYQFNRGPGAIIFIILVLIPSGHEFDLFGRILWPLVDVTAGFLLGT